MERSIRSLPFRCGSLPALLEHARHLGDAHLVATVVRAPPDSPGAQQADVHEQAEVGLRDGAGHAELACDGVPAVTPSRAGSPCRCGGKCAAGSFSHSRMSRRHWPAGILSISSPPPLLLHASTVPQPKPPCPGVGELVRDGTPLGTEGCWQHAGRGGKRRCVRWGSGPVRGPGLGPCPGPVRAVRPICGLGLDPGPAADPDREVRGGTRGRPDPRPVRAARPIRGLADRAASPATARPIRTATDRARRTQGAGGSGHVRPIRGLRPPGVRPRPDRKTGPGLARQSRNREAEPAREADSGPEANPRLAPNPDREAEPGPAGRARLRPTRPRAVSGPRGWSAGLRPPGVRPPPPAARGLAGGGESVQASSRTTRTAPAGTARRPAARSPVSSSVPAASRGTLASDAVWLITKT